jgi:hypothetical protein
MIRDYGSFWDDKNNTLTQEHPILAKIAIKDELSVQRINIEPIRCASFNRQNILLAVHPVALKWLYRFDRLILL